MSTANIIAPQGLGDVLWIYQKLAPHFSRINFELVDLGGMPTSMIRRAEKTIKCLAKVGDIKYRKFPKYPGELKLKLKLPQILDSLVSGATTYYSVNPWLEEGVCLEDIDPGYNVTHDLDVVPMKPDDFEYDPKSYVVLYVSGDTARHSMLCETIWAADKWVELIAAIYKKHNLDKSSVPVVLVGATFDHAITAYIWAALDCMGYGCQSLYDLTLPELLWLFGNSSLFVGYQSGLNVIADKADANQLMVYFPSVLKMSNSWVRPNNRLARFQYGSFDNSIRDLAARTVLRLQEV